MTIRTVCSIYDTIANEFGAPFTAVNQAVAARQFMAECHFPDPRGPMQTHPTDFVLYELGTFDSDKGSFELHPQPISVIRGTVRPAQ